MEALQHFPTRRSDGPDPDARRRTDAMLAILDEAAGIDSRLMSEPSADARRTLADRRAALAVTLMQTMQAWRRRGGTVRCESGPGRVVDRPAPRIVDVPTPQASRALIRTILDAVELAPDDTIELDRLHRAIRDSLRWNGLAREHRRGVVALFTTRLRRLQDDHSLVVPLLEEAFAMLTAYSKREQPGFVVGLSRSHQPVHGTWDADARVWWDRLEAAVSDTEPERGEEMLLDGVGKVVAAATDTGLPTSPEAVRGAVRAALDGGVSARDPRLIEVCAPVAVLLDDPEFRTLRRAIAELRG